MAWVSRASSYWGILLFRVYLCVKPLRDSIFKGLPLREAMGERFACASSYRGILVLLVLVLVVLLLLLLMLLLVVSLLLLPVLVLIYPKHTPSFGHSGSTCILMNTLPDLAVQFHQISETPLVRRFTPHHLAIPAHHRS